MAVSSEMELSDLEKEEWQEEFYEFLAFEAVQAFHKIKYDPSLSPQVTRNIQLPENSCLCIDLALAAEQRTFTGRLALTAEMLQSLRQKYTPRTLSYPKNIGDIVTLPVQLIAGHVVLERKVWREVQPGDFIVLDNCSLDLDSENKGRIALVVNETPLFRGKIKDGNIKILEYPSLQEVQPPMIKNKEDDQDFDEEEDTFEDEDFEEEYTEEEEEEEDPEETEEDLTEEEFEGDEEEQQPAVQPLKKSATAPAEPAKKAVQTTQAPAQTLVKPEEIPLTIAIEVGRLQMSLKQLIDLAPGNILELSVQPENGVDLVVAGRCIGKGELLKIGDALGVRVLDKA